MEKFEFKSQICTTKEQSERLLKLGLKKETADCALLPLTDKVTSVLVKPSTKEIKNTIPAWSLHRLLMLKDVGGLIGTGVYINDMNVAKCYEVVISRIEELLRNDAFDHDYLEENEVD